MQSVKSLGNLVDCLYLSKRKKHIFCEMCKLDYSLSLVYPNTYVCSEYCRREFFSKFYKQIQCQKCSINIPLKNNIYMGKDQTFCSEYCRIMCLRRSKI